MQFFKEVCILKASIQIGGTKVAIKRNNNKLFNSPKSGDYNYYLYVSFTVIILVSSLMTPFFLSLTNIVNIFMQNSVITILSLGQLIVIITGGIDLSVGSIVALSSCLIAGLLNSGVTPILAVLVVLLLMAILGGINGVLISYGKASPFLVTFSTMSIIRGVAYMYQTGRDLRISNENFIDKIIGQINRFPLLIIYMFLIAFVMSFILRRTVFGRILYAIGGNEEICMSAGIRVDRYIIAVYSISGLLAGVAGIILAAWLSMGTALVGSGYEIDAIVSVLLGGAFLNGGSGTVINTILGAFVMGVLNNILNLLAIPTYPQLIFKGLIVLVTILNIRRK